jgi:hypothetical protein
LRKKGSYLSPMDQDHAPSPSIRKVEKVGNFLHMFV